VIALQTAETPVDIYELSSGPRPVPTVFLD
jgi:hypothetical protein